MPQTLEDQILVLKEMSKWLKGESKLQIVKLIEELESSTRK